MTRGRVVSINGTPTKNVKPRQDIAWAVRGDRGLTYASKKPTNAKIVSGKWWSDDYSGEPLISMGANVARGLNLEIGDTITFNILGREIKAKIANLALYRLVQSSDEFCFHILTRNPGSSSP